MNSRIFFASDLHGSELAMNKLLNAAQFYGVKRIVVGGDITGKVLVPIIREGNRYSLELFGEQKKVKESGLEEVEREIRLNGEYYHIMERSEYEAVKDNPAGIKKLFLEEMLGSLDAFIRKAHEKLRASGARLFLIPGNDDYEEVAQYVKKNSMRSSGDDSATRISNCCDDSGRIRKFCNPISDHNNVIRAATGG